MTRYLSIVLFLVVLAAPFVLRAVIRRGDGDARPKAGADGGAGAPLRLVVITPHNQDIRREFARAFDAWHAAKYGRRVEVDYRVPGGTHDIKRQLEDTYRGWRRSDGSLDPRFVADVHVVWGGGNFFMDVELKRAGILQSMHLDPKLLREAFPEATLAGVRLYEESTDQPVHAQSPDATRAGELLFDESTDDAAHTPTPKWVGSCLSGYGLLYNRDVLRGLGIAEPTQWQDLADPRLAGQVALADPMHSGSAGIAYMSIVEKRMVDAEAALLNAYPLVRRRVKSHLATHPQYQSAIAAGWKQGMADLLLIAANARYFTDSAPQVPADVANGEAAAGIAIDFYGRVYQEAVGAERCTSVMPAGATVVTPDPVAILQGVSGEALQLATRFVEFQLTVQGQRLWILRPGHPGGPVERGLRRLPVRRDLYRDRAGWTDDVNPFEESRGFNQRADFETLFTEMRPLWSAAWIDSREALKSAHAAILRVPDEKRRGELLAELADLPITMKDVADFRAELERMKKANQKSEQRKARNRIDLVKKFRGHYREVERRARG